MTSFAETLSPLLRVVSNWRVEGHVASAECVANVGSVDWVRGYLERGVFGKGDIALICEHAADPRARDHATRIAWSIWHGRV